MDYEIEAVRQNIKRNKHSKKQEQHHLKKSKKSYYIISRIMLVIILTLVVLISIRSNNKFKEQFYKEVYEKNISFASINKLYKKYFGEPLPFLDILNTKTEPVFSEKLSYEKKEAYKDGVKVIVEEGYLVPVLESGMVVFVGEKEGYGKTVIVQQVNGVDVWYGNMKNISVKLYDYIEKGSLVGEVDKNMLYLVYKKDGKVLEYEKQLES